MDNGKSSPATRRAINRRSVLLGLAGVLFICGLAPYNDYAMGNTFLVGNFLPLGLVIATLLIALVINAPLRMLNPRLAFTQGELAVGLTMTLVACTIPTSGFMRYVPASIAGIYTHAAEPRYADALRQAGLRDWMMPQLESADPGRRGEDPVIRNYFQNTPYLEPGLTGALKAVPWHAWLRPAIAWGALAVALYGACWCISVIVHHQWVQNERLGFPLASVYASLIEDPEPGNVVNRVFRSKGFWIAFGAVFILHSFVVLNAYFPKNVPDLSLTYDLTPLLQDEPLNRTSWYIRKATLYFSIIGICFFLQGAVSFSLWSAVVILEVFLVFLRNNGSEITGQMQSDQNLGALVTFAVAILWIGRAHYSMVVRQMFGRKRETDPEGDFLSYGKAGWGLCISVAGMCCWLIAAGMSVLTAAWVVLFMLGIYLILARVVAETGLPFVQVRATVFRPLQYLQLLTQPTSVRIDNTSAFMVSWMNQTLIHDTRESATPFMAHAVRVADESIEREDRPSRWRFGLVICLALACGFIVSGASTLIVEYKFAGTLGVPYESPVNEYGVDRSSKSTLDFFISYTTTTPRETHSQPLHLLAGGLITGVAAALRLYVSWWPMHPIGFLLCYTFPMQMIWFSVFVGWLTKKMILWLGGPQTIRSCQPLFLGLIVGEAGVAGFWLLVNLSLHLLGFDYYAVRVLPT